MVVDMVVEHIDIPAFLIREGAVLNDTEKERTAMNRLQSILSTVPGTYPECGVDDCIYKNTFERLQVYFKSYQTTTEGKLTIDDLENIDRCWKSIVSINRLLNDDYPDELKNVFDLETIMLNIKSSKWGIDFNYVKTLYEDSVNNEQRRKLIEQLTNIETNIKTIESVLVDDTDPTNAINDLNNKITDLNQTRETLFEQITFMESDIVTNEQNRKLVAQLNGVNIGEVNSKIDKLNETIKTLNQLESSYNEHQRTYNDMMFQRQSISSELDALQTDDAQCKQTMNDLMINKERDRQYKLISDATSSTKGLPVVMIHNTLDESVKIANHLLNVIYDGNVHLNDVEVSETTLNIPFTHDLIISNDIRYGSQSESTIFALVLSLALSTQLTHYNIILIDEIDAYLDHEFKDKFILMLDEVSKLLKIDQLFMISHNINTEQFSNIINKIDLI
jgi:DNA repair exonuclease SbcCD ATPase subunit